MSPLQSPNQTVPYTTKPQVSEPTTPTKPPNPPNSGLMGKVLSKLALGRDPEIDLEPFSPQRFNIARLIDALHRRDVEAAERSVF